MSNDLGLTPVGRMTDLRADQINGQWLITWGLDLLDGIEPGDAAVYVYHDGDYVTRIVGDNHYWFTMKTDSTSDQIEFFVAPSGGLWEYVHDAWLTYDRVHLEWTLSGDAHSVRVMGNAGNVISGSTPIATITDITASIPDPLGHTSRYAYASGVWQDSNTLYDTITLEIQRGGAVDEADYEWTWGSITGTGTCRSYPDLIVNGVKVWFDEDTTYEAADSWTIRIGPAVEHTTRKWTATGNHAFRIDTANAAGAITTGYSTVVIAINPPPKRPTYYSSSTYVDGSGQITVTWTVNDDDAVSWRVYQSRPWTDERDTHWTWTNSGTSFSSGRFTSATLTLQAGYNRITATTLDASGQESGESDVFEIVLDSSLNRIVEPNPPYSIDAEVLASGDILITVWLDSTSTGARIYGDDHTGTVDYDTLLGTVINPGTSEINVAQLTLSSGLTDGLYLFAARAVDGTDEEANTDIVVSVSRITATATLATGLTAEVVHE